jgi:hypothetical protein
MTNPKKTRSTRVVCDDDSCLLEAEEDSTTDGSSAWLDVFCPQDSCEYTSPSQLP